jgi:hypothetical protein
MEAAGTTGERAEEVGGRGGTRGPPEGVWRAGRRCTATRRSSSAAAPRRRARAGEADVGVKQAGPALAAGPEMGRRPAKVRNSFFFSKSIFRFYI